MDRVKYSYCPRNAPRSVRERSNLLSAEGGQNVVMHLFDTLELKGLIPCVPYDEVIDKIYELDLKEKFDERCCLYGHLTIDTIVDGDREEDFGINGKCLESIVRT